MCSLKYDPIVKCYRGEWKFSNTHCRYELIFNQESYSGRLYFLVTLDHVINPAANSHYKNECTPDLRICPILPIQQALQN